jgi:hypothetical protein
MKLEVAESLFYSWCRHVQKCQVVQTNWKPSRGWDFSGADKEKLRKFLAHAKKFYQKCNVDIFPNIDFDQMIGQAEIDVLGLSFSSGKPKFYAVDVAFHSNVLGYRRNGKPNNVPKVIEKLLRATVCVHGFFKTTKAEIIFAAPKIPAGDLEKLEVCVHEMNERIKKCIGSGFSVHIISDAEDGFGQMIDEVRSLSDDVADTSELFLRSYQLLKMCKKIPK